MMVVAATVGLLLAGCTDLTDLDQRVKDLEGRMTKVEGLAATAGTNVTITISAAAEDLPEDVKKYL